jgi:SAM-dependent methyltransferase
MPLYDIIHRNPQPQPWTEGDNIPWNEPGFSARMLNEHLTQEHDHASRRAEKIDRHVSWVHTQLLNQRPSRILDLGCGPGLYAVRLAHLGHTCTGIDFSPASIEYARSQNTPGCTYHLGDLCAADFSHGYDLVMLIFGEFNVFPPTYARLILQKSAAALVDGGALLLEPHTFAAVKNMGAETPSWFSSTGGLFFDRPHVTLMDNHWDEASAAATQRYFIIDAESGAVQRFAASYQAYTNSEYAALLENSGFTEVRFYPALGQTHGEPDSSLIAISARKPAG